MLRFLYLNIHSNIFSNLISKGKKKNTSTFFFFVTAFVPFVIKPSACIVVVSLEVDAMRKGREDVVGELGSIMRSRRVDVRAGREHLANGLPRRYRIICWIAANGSSWRISEQSGALRMHQQSESLRVRWVMRASGSFESFGPRELRRFTYLNQRQTPHLLYLHTGRLRFPFLTQNSSPLYNYSSFTIDISPLELV